MGRGERLITFNKFNLIVTNSMFAPLESHILAKALVQRREGERGEERGRE